MKRHIAFLSAWFAACGSDAPASHHAASHGASSRPESDLPAVVLPAETVARLRIEKTTAKEQALPRTRLVGGEIVVPPGRSLTLTAPVAGEVHFVTGEAPTPGTPVKRNAPLLRLTAVAPTDRDTTARVGREVSAAEANLAALELRVTRNQLLIDQRAGSARALEEATAARDVARADLDAAKARAATLSRDPLLPDVAMLVRAPTSGVVRLLSVGEGQPVAAGAPLVEVAAIDALQVRVPVYSGDVARLDAQGRASVRHQRGSEAVPASFVAGPPTAEPDRSTVDRYLAVPADAGFVPGERVLVELPLVGNASSLTVPASSLVFDAWGGAWVYRCEGDRFARERVDPERRHGEDMVLGHGPPAGACVVSVGAAELFGVEFPPGH